MCHHTLNKKTILITGSSKGLGRELALELSGKESMIITHGRDEVSLITLKKEIEKKGHRNIVVRGDISKEQTLNSLISTSINNEVDIIINNVGQYLNGEFLNLDEKDFENILNVNFLSVVKLVKGVLPYFIKKKKGLIININSIAGWRENRTG